MKVILEKNKAIVEGVNMVSKHEKPSANSPQGGIVKKDPPAAPLSIGTIASPFFTLLLILP